jgi:hypothetical protein
MIMTKPLLRWTLGPCLQQGLDILAESINKTTRALGFDNFDWMICTNSVSRESLEFLKKHIGDRPIHIVNQNWADCPIDEECRSPKRLDGSFEFNGNHCGGSLWKVTPARMRMEAHEIVLDNDIVILRKFPEIDEFLASTNKALILQEPIRFYGRYDHLHGDAPFLNSGMMGFPPGFDFGRLIRETWETNGKLTKISQADEQGLLMASLKQIDSVRVKADQMIELLGKDYKTKLTGAEYGLHFTQANRMPSHYQWKKYRELIEQKALI